MQRIAFPHQHKRIQQSHITYHGSRIPHLLVVLLCLYFAALPSIAGTQTKTVADGVTLIQNINTDPTSPIVISILKVNLKTPGVKVITAFAGDTIIEDNPTKGREKVSSIVARTGAVAGVNADFFPFTGDPLGLSIMGGELVSEPMDRAAIGITDSGEVICDRMSFSGTITASSGETFPLRGLNRQRGKNELVLYTPIFGATTGATEGVELALELAGPIKVNTDIEATVSSDPLTLGSCSAIPTSGAILSAQGTAADWIMANIHNGDKIKLRFDIKGTSDESWDKVVQAVGGGSMLVRGGEIFTDPADEGFKPDFYLNRHPRTAAGVTSSGELLLVTVDGRQYFSQGMTIAELAQLMKDLGAVDAINLDGGGSTSLSIRGAVVNSPSEGTERPVANMLIVQANQPEAASGIKFTDANPFTIPSGPGRLMPLAYADKDEPINDADSANVVWGTTGGVGFVNQSGYFIPVKAGKGLLIAFYSGKKSELPVIVIPGAVANIDAKITADPSGTPNLGQVVVKLTDSNGNAVPNTVVKISVTGGQADSESAMTDDKGMATFNMTWDTTASDATITVSTNGITATAK